MSTENSGGSATQIQPDTFETRQIVLAKVRDLPPCPGMVIDPNAVPEALSKERPASRKDPVYAIRFFPSGDYAWLAPTALSRLTPAQVNKYLMQESEGRKPGDFMEGYKKALEPTPQEEAQAANAPMATQRKMPDKDGDDPIELADAEQLPANQAEKGADKEMVGMKRKRALSPAPAKSKAKTAKGKKAKRCKAAVASAPDAHQQSAAGAHGEEVKAPAAKAVEGPYAHLESDPEAVKVREWRHKLQKTFLSTNKAPPKAAEMPTVDILFTTVEEYQKMNIEYLMFTKIGKVMRHITLLDQCKVPRDDEFKFRHRAQALIDKWHAILNPAANTETAAVTESTTRMEDNGTAEGEGDLTITDVLTNRDKVE
ncbi:hypothetical protein DFH06DRAFT_348191, partial [Mycena polygramma]